MQISNIRLTESGGLAELRADIKCDTHWVWGDEAFPLWIQFDEEFLSWMDPHNADPFLVMFLVPAMVLGESLKIEGRCSPKLLQGVRQAQSILNCWNSDLHQIDLDVEVRSREPIEDRRLERKGLFFSMGVDSSYELWKDQQLCEDDSEKRITDLLVVEGFDVYLWERQRFPPMLESITRVAEHFQKKVVCITTNLREFSDRMANWLRFYHGSALASMALAMGDYFKSVSISASQTYSNLIPRGTHPLLDPLWSSEKVEFMHDGLEAERLQKILSFSQSDTLVKNLRVCATSEITNAYNCCECEKCLRTMIALHIAGVLDNASSFPARIDTQKVINMPVRSYTAFATLKNLLAALGVGKRDSELRDALQQCLDKFDVSCEDNGN